MQGHAAAQVLARLQRAASCGSDEGSGHHARDGFLLARASQSSSASPSSARSMQLRGSADEARAAALQGDLLATRLQQDTWRHAVQLMPLEPAGRHQLQPTPPPPPPPPRTMQPVVTVKSFAWQSKQALCSLAPVTLQHPS